SPAGAHRWSLFIFVLLASLIALAPARIARAQGMGNVPNGVKTATEVTQYKAQIEAFVTAAVQQLAADAPDAQAKARQALEAESKVNGQPTASPVYLDAYTIILATHLQPLLTNPNLRVRMNVAIATANIAQVADNDHLKDIALALVSDKNEAVVLWGIKASRFIIPAQLRAFAQKDLRLLQAIVPAVKAHAKGIVA